MPAAVVPRRALRAGLAAAAAVGTALLAHHVGHGTLDVTGAAWAFAALAGPAWWLAGRELGWGRLALVQLAGQQLAHLALATAAGTGSSDLLPVDLMFHAHLAAAALTAVWLRVGERRAWAAVRRLARVVLGPVTAVPAVAETRQAPILPWTELPVTRFLRHVLARRGPPPHEGWAAGFAAS